MGSVVIRYRLGKLKVLPSTLVNEIEYGSTFALYPGQEDIIPIFTGNLKWLSWEEKDRNLTIRVDDNFLEIDSLFEKITTAFLYNLLDFGEVQLLSIDLSDSSYFKLETIRKRETSQVLQLFNSDLMLGTIFKPYYHLSLHEKIALVEKFIGMGINIIKEDEIFLAPEEQLLDEAKSIQEVMGEHNLYIPNLTHQVNNYNLIEKLLDCGIKVIMLDFLVTGFRSILRIRQRFPELFLWGHRIGYITFERFISIAALGTLAMIAGIDFLHIGTPISNSDIRDKIYLVSHLRQINSSFIPVFTKTTPNLLPQLIRSFGKTAVFMACGYFRNEEGKAIDWARVKEWVSKTKNA